MSLVKCPKCTRQGFTWYAGDDQARPTNWRCHYCGYSATEDESKEALCPSCGVKTFGLLTDEAETYRHCHRCSLIQVNNT